MREKAEKGGIVLKIGGQLSHCAIIAREYAIPAVINAQDALQSIRDGQTILFDGTLGRVYLEEASETWPNET